MLEEKNILFFKPFTFKNGDSKDKFFVVLKTFDNGNSLLASLPSSQDYVPERYETQSGCIEAPEINFNCYVINNGLEVTECGKQFHKRTYLYGIGLDQYNSIDLNNKYPNEGYDYEIFGKMKENIFNDIIDCFKKSNIIKRKFIKILNS